MAKVSTELLEAARIAYAPDYEAMSKASRDWVDERMVRVVGALVERIQALAADALTDQHKANADLDEARSQRDVAEADLTEANRLLGEERLRADRAEQLLAEARVERDAALRRVDQVHEMLGDREDAAEEANANADALALSDTAQLAEPESAKQAADCDERRYLPTHPPSQAVRDGDLTAPRIGYPKPPTSEPASVPDELCDGNDMFEQMWMLADKAASKADREAAALRPTDPAPHIAKNWLPLEPEPGTGYFYDAHLREVLQVIVQAMLMAHTQSHGQNLLRGASQQLMRGVQARLEAMAASQAGGR